MSREKRYNRSTSPVKRLRNTTRDIDLFYATDVNPQLEAWRVLGTNWLASVNTAKKLAMVVLKKFLIDYLHEHSLEMNPAIFLSAGYEAPCFAETCLGHFAKPDDVNRHYSKLCDFIEYILLNNFSVEDDFGRKLIPQEVRNPIPVPATMGQSGGSGRTESDKEILPFKYISELRNILCPPNANSFKDWEWAYSIWDKDLRTGGDWFEVDPSLVDPADPDCISRVREVSDGTHRTRKKQITEIWYPGRAVALYFKLELPLRTYQVRMLDSGEGDTLSYVKGIWQPNENIAARGTDRKPCSQGFLRKIRDPIQGLTMTGLFINTNKTADSNKDENNRGYVIPWEHERVIYWAEKLRDWQSKYNPIARSTPWANLTGKHLGSIKPNSVLEAMGEACFLFRDAREDPTEVDKPIAENSLIVIWRKLLTQLEVNCAERCETAINGLPLKFVSDTQNKTFYPLHSLRVSLITAFALEGGVPMPILSKCIAGHSRLLMTLYYTKAGIAYVSDQMEEAEKRLRETEKENFGQWLRNATYKELELNGAYTDPVAIQAVFHAQNSGASLIRDSKGICPKGGMACDTGGTYYSDDSNNASYGPVPGFPEKNCTRCRWFFTGPAFLDGLISHWNLVHLKMGDNGQYAISLEQKISTLDDEKYHAESSNSPFIKQHGLDSLQKAYQSAIELNDKLANDSTATLRLIIRTKQLIESSVGSDGVSLVAAGRVSDVKISINECSKLEAMLRVSSAGLVSIETDMTKTMLETSRAYDLMLSMNDASPMFFKLEGDELESAVRHMSNLLRAEAGSFSNAIPFIEGVRKLSELGINATSTDFTYTVNSNHGKNILLTTDLPND